ncbi:hypothetical protein J2S06_001610 [Bacillus alveayuensis]|uniref:Uncharacterized protein n=2 Tax=Aeribacillus alveayuensis TaxID=279215 RepID=A0ABT9VNI2_9BACI|nr:hypothetical protein [Bacillus alveayuensis]
MLGEIVQKSPFRHLDNISDGFFSGNYIVRKLAHLSVFGVLAFLAWKAMSPHRFAWRMGHCRFMRDFRRMAPLEVCRQIDRIAEKESLNSSLFLIE